MEYIEDAITFRDRFYAFFVTDDNIRWKTIGFIIVSGAAFAGLDIFFFNSPLDELMTFLTAWVLICYVVSVGWYCWFKTLSNVEPVPGRRLLLQAAVAVIAFVIAWRIPRVEARTIERILRAAQTSSPQTSARLIDSANALILVARQERIPVDQQYFQNIISILNSIAARTNNAPVDEAIHSSRISLAEYSSALQALPPQYGEIIFGPMEHALKIIGGRDQVYKYVRWDFRKVTGNAIVLEGKPVNITFQDSIIEGGNQTLDGIKWHGVTFIGSHISYQGGYTELENVRFVNCTFEAPPSLQGQHFLEMATLSLPKFVG